MNIAAEHLQPGQVVRYEVSDNLTGTWETYTETAKVLVAEREGDDVHIVSEVITSTYPADAPFQVIGRKTVACASYWDSFEVV